VDSLKIVEKVSTIIDIGCGHGSYSLLFLERFPSCNLLLGVDVSGIRIQEARQSVSDSRVSYVVADAKALPFRKSSFRLAFCKDVLHHVEKPVKVLKETARVSKGFVVIEANRPNLLMLFQTKYGHHQHFMLDQLKVLFDEAEIKVENLKQIHAYPFDLTVSRIQNIGVFLWDVLVAVFLFACYLAPALIGKALKTLSLILKPSFTAVYCVSGRSKTRVNFQV